MKCSECNIEGREIIKNNFICPKCKAGFGIVNDYKTVSNPFGAGEINIPIFKERELMKELDAYNESIKAIHEYFGYKEDWVVIPIDDGTDYYWRLNLNEDGGGTVDFGETTEEIETYSNEIYTQRFLKKWVYRGKDFTMICVDTQMDGNKFLQIFDNSKEIKENS